MSKANPYFKQLEPNYIFPIIEKKLEEIKTSRPSATILNFGIGDIALPIREPIITALINAAKEMAIQVRGYGPSVGYDFLKQAIVSHEYANYGITPDEVFISEGTNHDAVNFLELFDKSCTVALMDPTYPAYLKACILNGKARKKTTSILFLPCTLENSFIPTPPQEHVDIIYLCTPNNPTGVALTRNDLTRWVNYALDHKAVILVDAAYEAFISSPEVPRSIYEIPNAHQVAIEMRSFSKSSGFTGLRCAYSIVPKALKTSLGRKKVPLHTLWTQRQNIKTNGVAYPIQKAAEAALSLEAQTQTSQDVLLYLHQAHRLKEFLVSYKQHVFGGIDSPYLWWKVPNQLSSWEFCEHLLHHLHLVSIPGSAFGSHGEGYIRLSCFTTSPMIDEAISRLRNYFLNNT